MLLVMRSKDDLPKVRDHNLQNGITEDLHLNYHRSYLNIGDQIDSYRKYPTI